MCTHDPPAETQHLNNHDDLPNFGKGQNGCQSDERGLDEEIGGKTPIRW